MGIKVFEFVKRVPSLSPETFQRRYRDEVAAEVAGSEAARRHLSRYELNLRLPLDYRRDRHAIEVAEASTEGHQHVVVDLLPGEPQDKMFTPGLQDPLKDRVADRPGKVDTMYVGAQRTTGRLNPYVAHRRLLAGASLAQFRCGMHPFAPPRVGVQ